MATYNIVIVLLLTLCYFCSVGRRVSAEQPPAPDSAAADSPASAVNCLRNMLNVSDCLSYVQVGSNETKPDGACCSELAGMVESSPECVCNLLGGGASGRFGIKLDKNRALQLPPICGFATPSPSLCSGFPTVAPAGSESADSQSSEVDNKNGGPTAGASANDAVLLAWTIFMLFF